MKMQITIKRKLAITLIVLLFALAVAPVLDSQVVYAATKADESLVNSVSSPSNGVIQFKIKCPANSTVSYTISLTPNNKNSSIDKKTGSLKNSSKMPVTKTVKYPAKFFSNKYKISANATIGHPRLQNHRVDTDKATSELVKNYDSKKVTWTKDRIKKYNKKKAVAIIIPIVAGITIDILVTKGLVTASWGKAFSVINYSIGGAQALDSLNQKHSTYYIQSVPRQGYSWKIRYVKEKSGYTSYLLVYNNKGKYDSSYKLGTYTYNTITPAVH